LAQRLWPPHPHKPGCRLRPAAWGGRRLAQKQPWTSPAGEACHHQGQQPGRVEQGRCGRGAKEGGGQTAARGWIRVRFSSRILWFRLIWILRRPTLILLPISPATPVPGVAWPLACTHPCSKQRTCRWGCSMHSCTCESSVHTHTHPLRLQQDGIPRLPNAFARLLPFKPWRGKDKDQGVALVGVAVVVMANVSLLLPLQLQGYRLDGTKEAHAVCISCQPAPRDAAKAGCLP